ncbi:DsrE family protein [Flexistipes sp.]|uniref:DsrE family protein n=1 Tax=Flexistipes sp. TaxID=3088135 RepID=UPI002E1B0059|nr:DsrE family protein [Flexistipes sp.]
MKRIIVSFIIFLLAAFSAQAQESENTPVSLKGVDTAEIVFDVNVGNPKLLSLRLKLIEKTLSDISSHTKYRAVVAFRGAASDFMTKNDNHIEKDEKQIKKDIYLRLKTLKNDYNVTLEQCAVAIGLRGISPEEIYDIINVVENGYVSIIGYQNQGYAFVPMD